MQKNLNPNTADNAYDAFINNKYNIDYADGYYLENDEIEADLLKEAIEVAKIKL